MDRNLLLAFALSFLVLSLWTIFQDRGQKGRPESPEAVADSAAEPSAEAAAEFEGKPLEPIATRAPEPEAPKLSVPQETGTLVAVNADLFHAELSTLGAGISRWELRNYTVKDVSGGAAPVVLTTGGATLLTPFEELGLGDLSAAVFDLSQPDANTFAFQLERRGVRVRKTYHFEPNSYAFRLRVDVENGSAAALAPRFELIATAALDTGLDFREQALVALHDGSVVKQMLQELGTGGILSSVTGRAPQLVSDYPDNVDWAGVDTTYFLSAALPDRAAQASVRFATVEPGKVGITAIHFPPVEVPPGRSAEREFRGYLGPKETARLEAMSGGLIHSIDLGWSWVTPMTRFFVWLLGALYQLVPNYGVAIIVLTVMVRVVTAPLTTRQMRSMERMRSIQPKLKEIQEKHADDRQKQSEETMRLYRAEGVNPLGGCLPMLLQLPVMVGLFYALRSSIHLRQAPFFGWIDDLSAPETLFMIPGLDLPVRLLPVVMGATMVLQQRMTPMNVDPTQARMMQTVMPIMMTFLFYQFASGLVLYWMVGNVLAIAHQLWIRRQQTAKE